ncbi:MAG: phospholipid/glycerol acyltransferase [Myxococcales bacterium]|nr:phospholipid/glycerol acyltransferase [Myxococcales bacterium]
MSSGSSYGATVFALYKTLAISVPTFADAMLGRLTIERGDERLRDWSNSIVRHADVDLTVEGLANVPRDRACIYMSNHQSHLDIPILFSVFPGTLRMVAKAELFKVPIWGRAMKEAGFVRVTRSGNRVEAMAAMRECAEALGRGINVWLAPEGTRSLDGKLGKFKKGGFMLARDTGADIIPIAIDGSRDILPKNTKIIQRGARVKVSFGKPIPVAGKDSNTLSAEVLRFMAANVTEPSA